VLGQDPVPGIPQNVHLEEELVVSPAKVVAAIRNLVGERAHRAERGPDEPRPAAGTRLLWIPNRQFVA
jgi:hypothetical protein